MQNDPMHHDPMRGGWRGDMRVAMHASRAAQQGLRGLQLLALASLGSAGLVWWLTLGEGAFESVGGALGGVVLAVALALPGVVLWHLGVMLQRAARFMAELQERLASGELSDHERQLFWTELRLAMRRRGVALLLAPWYWLAALWAVAASIVLVVGALVLGLTQL